MQHTIVPRIMLRNKQEFTESLVDRIEKVQIENKDALIVLDSRNVSDAFHYIDPPYPNADQGHYNGYSWGEYECLLEWISKKCKGKFLLSSYNSPLLEEYIQKNRWLKSMHTFNNKGLRKNDRSKFEILIRNYNEVSQLKLSI
jgi:DNA adenine methylase